MFELKRTMLEMRRETIETNRQFAGMCCDYLSNGRFDLFLAIFGMVHRGTHYLWDLSQIDTAGADEAVIKTLRGAREDCYVSIDEQLGRIIDAATPDARFVTFALHGMEPNDGWYEYLPQLVERVHHGGKAAARPKKGVVFHIKNALPWTLVRQVTRRIPHAWNKALVQLGYEAEGWHLEGTRPDSGESV